MVDQLEEGTKSNLSAYQSERVADAFLNAAVFELALGTRGNASGRAQYVHSDTGPDTIIAPFAGGGQGVFKATSHLQVNHLHDKSTIVGDLASAQGRRSVEITMDPSHNESVNVKDSNDVTLIKTFGGWSPAADHKEAAHFTLSRANTTLATVQGTRELLGSNHEKIHYTLYSPNDLKMTLGTIDVDKQTSDGILTMDIKVNRNSA